MKREIEEIAKKTVEEPDHKKITRKEALKKSGYFALTAATMMILLSTPKKAAASPAGPTPWP
jgi:hypothetical protein